jgi:hypothetical protein
MNDLTVSRFVTEVLDCQVQKKLLIVSGYPKKAASGSQCIVSRSV